MVHDPTFIFLREVHVSSAPACIIPLNFILGTVRYYYIVPISKVCRFLSQFQDIDYWQYARTLD